MDLLHAPKLRHGTDGFTSPPKEGMLWIFTPEKIQTLRPGLNPRTWVSEANVVNTKPQKKINILEKIWPYESQKLLIKVLCNLYGDG
jgi:hypothetical protein